MTAAARQLIDRLEFGAGPPVGTYDALADRLPRHIVYADAQRFAQRP